MTKNQEIKENARKRQIIDSGKTLFSKFGYRKVTIEEICRAAGVSKMTYYRFFENKIDLVRFILTEMSDEGRQTYRAIMALEVPFEEKVRRTIKMKEESAAKFSDELLRDVYEDREGELVSVIEKMTVDFLGEVMADYRKAQEEGHVRKDLNLKIIPYFLNQINNMVKDPALNVVYQGNMKAIMKELTNLFFYGIMEPERGKSDEK
jgi:AcrR family transcriptional regulator